MSEPLTRAQLTHLLNGLDQCESAHDAGWWETSTGAARGASLVAALLAHDAALRAQLTAMTERGEKLEEWKRIVTGTGTDQEAVIRLAAIEYTVIAVQCWKDKVNGLEQQLVESDRVKQGLDNDVRVLFVRIEELRKQLAEAHSEIARLQERS